MPYIKTISSKGQITLPKAMREQLGVRPGDFVALSVRGEVLRLEKKRPRTSDRRASGAPKRRARAGTGT